MPLDFKKDLQEYVSKFNRKGILFYDIEVYKYDSFVVFLDIDGNKVAYYHIDTGFDDLHELVKDNILVGYNNYFYDDFVLTTMLDRPSENTRIKATNDNIIKYRDPKIEISPILVSLDCMQQIDATRLSLKKIEANKGVSIEETPISFDIDRKLTEEELERAIYYCTYDVQETVKIFKERFYNYFMPKMYVLNLLNNKAKMNLAYRWNTTTISANVVMPDFSENLKVYKLHNLVPEHILNYAPPEAREMWLSKISGEKPERTKVTIRDFNNKIEFGFGGIHSVHESKKVFENVVAIDFASLYPNIMINHHLLGKFTENLKEMVDKRLKAKAKMRELETLSDWTEEQEIQHRLLDSEQGALKLVINSVYGLLNNKYSRLYAEMRQVAVCVIGQCYLYELAKRLSSCCTICQLNTDGIYLIPHDNRYKEIYHQFEQEVNIKLDEDKYEKLYQKDVNNYIAILNDDTFYLKGGDTNRYYKNKPYQNNSARICQIALVDYITKDTDPLETILKHRDEPLLYQYILQAGSTYKGTYDDDGKEYQKVNRVFATTIPNHVTLKKYKADGSSAMFANSPSKMFVWNKDVDELNGFKDIVDVGHYLDITNRMIELWGAKDV